ncbi:VOC family protein [Actinoplanes sp. NPDC023801]|uniref:VOC family protein n=1 Tax=Actinoplanes sp. NPDC023801 TaxID=3154595 RepID=UPI0033C52AB8
MASRLFALRVDAVQPERLAGFWAAILGWERDGVLLSPPGGGGFRLRFVPEQDPKTVPNLMHFDLTSDTLADQERTVARALELGGRHIDIGQGPDVEHVVLADPEGNEFCVIEPGNSFLDGCGFIGAVSSDGSPRVGHFWAEALGWPLIWDQDEETAIQSSDGGSKITWGGPPYQPRSRKLRWAYELIPPPGGDRDAEADRLIALGAARTGTRDGDLLMSDPDGNEFRLLG